MSRFKNADKAIADVYATMKNILEYREASALDEDSDRNTLLSLEALVHTMHIFQLTINRKFFAYITGIRPAFLLVFTLETNTLSCCNSSLHTGKTWMQTPRLWKI